MSSETQPLAGARSRSLWRQPVVWLGFALSGLAVATFIALFDLGLVARALVRVRWGHVLLAAAVFMTAFMVRGLRWKWLLTPMGRFPFRTVRDVLVIGYMVNLLLPARMGELAKALGLWKVTGASRRGALTSIGLGKLLDGSLLAGALVLLGMLVDLPAWAMRITHAFMGLMAALLVVMLWLAFHERSFFWLMERSLFFLPSRVRTRVVGFFSRFAAGSHALRRPGLLAACGLATVVIWSLEFVVYTLVMHGFGIALPAWAPLLAVVVTNIGIAVPSAPGAVGVFEAACSGALLALGLGRELALSYALGVHLMMFTCLVGFGQFYLWRLGLRLSDVTDRDAPA